MINECYGCTRRSAEPNCHNPETCRFWAKHMAEQERKREKKQEEIATRKEYSRYKKASNGRQGDYLRGSYKPLRSIPGRTIVQQGGK